MVIRHKAQLVVARFQSLIVQVLGQGHRAFRRGAGFVDQEGILWVGGEAEGCGREAGDLGEAGVDFALQDLFQRGGVGIKASKGVDGLACLAPLAQPGVEQGHRADDVAVEVAADEATLAGNGHIGKTAPPTGRSERGARLASGNGSRP